MSRRKYDVVIVGGAVTGSSTAYFLTSNPDFDGTVAIIEMDPTFAKSATALSSSSIRHQFSNAVNVRMSQFGTEFIRSAAELLQVDELKPDLCFRENGYLFLAGNEAQEKTLRRNHEVQVSCGAAIELLDPDELARAFPHLNVSDVRLASYGVSGEGWFSNTGLMDALRQKARHLGADLIVGEVCGIQLTAGKVSGISLTNGESIDCDHLVNAAGTRAARVATMVGLDLPVEPRRRMIYIFDCANSPQGTATVNNGQLPLMIDISGTFCRPEGEYFMTGMSPVDDPTMDPDDFEPRYEEFDLNWMNLAQRSKHFEAIKMVNCWTGHYDYNTLDQNAIVGPSSEITNFFFGNGFSGHGLQQSPAVGRGISECIIYGGYRALDLSELSHDRVMRGEPFIEQAII